MTSTDDSFYINLNSNVHRSSPLQISNTIGNFVTRLSRRHQLEGDYEVALSKFHYSKSWYNVEEDQELFLVDQKGSYNALFEPFPAGNYVTVEEMLEILNKLYADFAKEQDIIKSPKFEYNTYSNMIRIHLGRKKNEYLYPQMSNFLANFLGLCDRNGNQYPFNKIIGVRFKVKSNRILKQLDLPQFLTDDTLSIQEPVFVEHTADIPADNLTSEDITTDVISNNTNNVSTPVTIAEANSGNNFSPIVTDSISSNLDTIVTTTSSLPIILSNIQTTDALSSNIDTIQTTTTTPITSSNVPTTVVSSSNVNTIVTTTTTPIISSNVPTTVVSSGNVNTIVTTTSTPITSSNIPTTVISSSNVNTIVTTTSTLITSSNTPTTVQSSSNVDTISTATTIPITSSNVPTTVVPASNVDTIITSSPQNQPNVELKSGETKLSEKKKQNKQKTNKTINIGRKRPVPDEFQGDDPNVDSDKLDSAYIDAFQQVLLHGYMHNLNIYCNLLKPVSVGDIEAPLLRTVALSSNDKFGEYVKFEPNEREYIPLLYNEFDNIEIDIKNDYNKTIDFKFGKVYLSLHFRRINNHGV